MLSGTLKENVIEEGETKEELSKRKRDERKKNLHEGKLHRQFVEFLKKETDGMLLAAQEQALRVNAKIDKQPILPKCRQLCI